MTDLVFSTGAFILCAAIMLAWIFRTSSAHLAAKIVMPIALVALGIKIAFTLDAMTGYPVHVKLNELPDHARLVGYVEYDRIGEADLWLVAPNQPPRAYHITLPANSSRFRKAGEEARSGTPVYLWKAKGADGQKFEFRQDGELPAK